MVERELGVVCLVNHLRLSVLSFISENLALLAGEEPEHGRISIVEAEFGLIHWK